MEHLLAKEGVAGSIPVSRSFYFFLYVFLFQILTVFMIIIGFSQESNAEKREDKWFLQKFEKSGWQIEIKGLEFLVNR